MKVLVVDFAASEGGAMTILQEFYEEAKKHENNDYIFLLSDNYLKPTKNIKVLVIKKAKKHLYRLKFDYFTGKNTVKKYNPDIIFSLQNTAIRGVKTKQVIYIHQPLPFQNIKKFSFLKKTEFKYAKIQYLIGKIIKDSIKISDTVIVQTQWMKDTIAKQCHKSLNKVFIVHPSIQNNTIKQAKPRFNSFFYPTSNYIYKNNSLIKEAAERLKEKNVNDFEVELTIDGKSSNNIKKIGYLSNKEITKKYSESILVFPSYIESFGLPLLEAKEAGTIILAADTPFSREILEDYNNAFFFNPFSSKELADLMKKCINGQIKLHINTRNIPKTSSLTISDVLERVTR